MEASKPMKKETISLANCIKLEKDKVKAKIAETGYYEEEGVKIKNWEGDKETEYYIGDLKKGKSKYLGVLNVVLKRENYGVNYYDNGDIYFGMFDSDVKNKHGAYFFAPTVEEGHILSEVYHGYWKANMKEMRGMYVWLKEKENDTCFDTSDMEAFVGEIESDLYKRGCYLTKINYSFYVYYGSFDRDGKKNDENAFFYDNVRDRVFNGKIVNDKFVNGYMAAFDENSEIKSLIYLEFDHNDTPTEFLKAEEIDEATKELKTETISKFRNFLLGEDHFTMVYNKVKQVRAYIDTDMQDMEVIDSETDYPKLMNIGSSYNDIKVYSNLEKLMK